MHKFLDLRSLSQPEISITLKINDDDKVHVNPSVYRLFGRLVYISLSVSLSVCLYMLFITVKRDIIEEL